jgi:hypothetical protein
MADPSGPNTVALDLLRRLVSRLKDLSVNTDWDVPSAALRRVAAIEARLGDSADMAPVLCALRGEVHEISAPQLDALDILPQEDMAPWTRLEADWTIDDIFASWALQ